MTAVQAAHDFILDDIVGDPSVEFQASYLSARLLPGRPWYWDCVSPRRIWALILKIRGSDLVYPSFLSHSLMTPLYLRKHPHGNFSLQVFGAAQFPSGCRSNAYNRPGRKRLLTDKPYPSSAQVERKGANFRPVLNAENRVGHTLFACNSMMSSFFRRWWCHECSIS